ncbi:hypothetical protein D6D12_06797 [Aureobasidium pullulans]|uniref:Zn(2)-C6 fungal-type domain-containing protein n=1 Tax=Aureobasidium pullulans TaxID=5580 RepID=A0AB74JNP9_AURPU|nr:hypothetical protein D6D12_06797 [Aureobasidium pullulans]
MSEEPPAKRIRKGTRSCQECRHRKVRCIWPSDNAQVCQGCLTRHRTCELQVEIVQSSDAPKLTSKARIAILEDQITKLWGAINGGIGSIATNPGRTRDNVADSIPSGSHSRNQSSPDSSNPSSPTNPPTHLLHLFDNDLLDSNGHEAVTPSTRMASSTMSKESISLLKSLPSREDMVIIAANASAWLSWYKVLFSLNLAMGAGEKMLSNYDKVKSSEKHPVPIATVLLAVAITVQQAPEGHAMNRLRSITNPSAFLKDVSNLVEKVIVSNDDLIASLDGIRCALLFIRLEQNQKAEVWESICAIDRITAMMCSLPIATVNFPLPVRPIIDMNGEVILQSFIHRLFNIASRVLELDDIHTQKKSIPELINIVMATDQELQTLAQAPAKSWWQEHGSQMSKEALFQYWHSYFTIRTHLRLALAYEHDQRFLYNFMTCFSACQEHAKRYISLRPLLPAGFFASSIVDLQAFTAIVFLLLATDESKTASSSVASRQNMNAQQTRGLVDQAVETMELAAKRTGNGSARHGVDAIRSLSSLLRQPSSTEGQQVSLLLPLIGRIHVSRKAGGSGRQNQVDPYMSNQGEEAPRDPPDGYGADSAGSNYMDPDLINPLSYSMEIPEDYLFFTDQSFGAEQWLTWTN